jgi:hypothetical protein
MRTFLLFMLLNVLSAGAHAQKSAPFSRLIFGSQYGYVPQTTTELLVADIEAYRFHEHLWTNYLMTNLSRRWTVGFDYMFIFTRSTETGSDRFYYAGANVQYDFFSPENDRYRMYVETGLHQSNYCTCDPEPYKKAGLLYTNIGIGYSHRILPSVHLALRFPVFNFALNGPKEFHGFHYYTVGLEFRP